MRELHIDWAALHSAFQMNMPEVKCFLCVEDGRVLKLPPGDPALGSVRAEAHRYLPIEAVPSRIQYQWLDDFIRSVTDPEVKIRMEAAINGKGAFRRFKDILLELPDERRRWFESRDQMMRQRIIEWVREQGILALNDPPWLTDAAYVSPPEGGGIAPGGTAPNFVTSESLAISVPPSYAAISGSNSSVDIEALRDYLIEWADGQGINISPISLENLAHQISTKFRITQVVRSRI